MFSTQTSLTDTHEPVGTIVVCPDGSVGQVTWSDDEWTHVEQADLIEGRGPWAWPSCDVLAADSSTADSYRSRSAPVITDDMADSLASSCWAMQTSPARFNDMVGLLRILRPQHPTLMRLDRMAQASGYARAEDGYPATPPP